MTISAIGNRLASRLRSAGFTWRRILGSRADWRLNAIRPTRPEPGLQWSGPVAIVVSVLVSWWAFSGASGREGSVAFGLYIGAVSIQLMAWSFLLALRLRPLERFFGGLDSMYRSHRWAGVLSVAAMYLHTANEPEIDGGIRGASKSVADAAEDLAGTGQNMLYILVGISFLRWIPYRWWRLTHKLLGIPFAFAAWHFYTAEKSYANGSAWGWWFGSFMVVGLVAFLTRVVVRDVAVRGKPYRITETIVRGSTLELVMEATGKPVRYTAGQFAVLKVQRKGLSEPHIFTIASSPNEDLLRFFIRDLGDWTHRMHNTELVGERVLVEAPYGEFEPTSDSRNPTVWIAGGVGVTPFLAATSGLSTREASLRPTLFYCVRNSDDAMAIDVLQEAVSDGKLELVICDSETGSRFSDRTLLTHFGPDGLTGAHVAVCGPAGLVSAAKSAATALGATRIEQEGFDIRQGLGPDLSREVEALFSPD